MADSIVAVTALTFQIIALCMLHKSGIDLSYETAEVRNYVTWLIIFWFTAGILAHRWITFLVKFIVGD